MEYEYITVVWIKVCPKNGREYTVIVETDSTRSTIKQVEDFINNNIKDFRSWKFA